MNRRVRRFRDLPLFWKFLLPSLALLVVVGAVGTFAVVRNLSERAQTAVDEELSSHALDARTVLHDREFYLLESVNFASNVRGMDRALAAGDARSATTLLESVLALKRELGLLAVTDSEGRGVTEFVSPAVRSPKPSSGRDWSVEPFVASALDSSNGARSSGFLRAGGKTILAIAGPVCSTPSPCNPAGVAIAGVDVDVLASGALARLETQLSTKASPGIAVFGLGGSLLARAGVGSPSVVPPMESGSARRFNGDTETLFVPFEVQGRKAGFVGVTVPRAPAFEAVHGTGIRLAFIVLGAMVGLVGLMALLSRRILVQVRPLVATNRALGEGNMAARVPVKSRDELGELAQGVNKMAEQLQASYETLEARVAERTAEVRHLLEQRSEFFTAISHEFRTPLAVILGEANLLEDGGRRLTTEESRDAGRALRLSAEQLLAAINEILDLAQSEAGTIDIDLEEVRLGELIKELRPTIDGLAKNSGLRVNVSLPRTVTKVVADRARLKEVILNLVDNAVKYTPEGGSVDIRARTNNGRVELSVADTGVGVPPEVGDRIFEPFFRVEGTKPVRGQASSGLGLALAKRLIEAQGGAIAFESRPEGGTVFSVSLKRASDAR